MIAVTTSTSGRVAFVHSGAMPYRGRYRGTRLRSPAIAEAPANHRMEMVLRSYACRRPRRGTRARDRRARGRWQRLPARSAAGGTSRVVTRLLASSNTLMIRRRWPGAVWCSGYGRPAAQSMSSGSPRTSGMTTTPVSKPDSPRASFGNSSAAASSTPEVDRSPFHTAARQFASTPGLATGGEARSSAPPYSGAGM